MSLCLAPGGRVRGERAEGPQRTPSPDSGARDPRLHSQALAHPGPRALATKGSRPSLCLGHSGDPGWALPDLRLYWAPGRASAVSLSEPSSWSPAPPVLPSSLGLCLSVSDAGVSAA